MNLGEMRDRIQQDLDLEDETFVDDTDINYFINKAIKKAERIILRLYEDYFISSTTISISSGIQDYSYPTNIYSSKIRKIVYFNSGTRETFEVRPVKNLADAIDYDIRNYATTLPVLMWSNINTEASGPQIRLWPSQARDGQLIVYFIRNAKQLSSDSDETEIDEFSEFIIQDAKTEIYLKDGDPRADDSKVLATELAQDMVLTLSSRAPDGNNEIEMDLSFYEDMVGGEYNG